MKFDSKAYKKDVRKMDNSKKINELLKCKNNLKVLLSKESG